MTSSRTPYLPRMAGLDGLRGVAVALVLAYHLGIPGFFEAGFLGVDIFFVISGFIITTGILERRQFEGRVELGSFWRRRIRRLVPPALAMVLVATAVTWVADPVAGRRALRDLPAALLYVSNWWQILAEQPYFESFGMPPVLRHLWSLAVEMQYYLLWPFVLALLLDRFRLPLRSLALVAAALGLASTAWMALCAAAPDGANRAYLGSDSHAMGLLAGSALACLCPRPGPWSCQEPGRWTALLRAAGVAALLGLGVATWTWNESSAGLYGAGFLCVALLACFTVLASIAPEGWVARSMAHPVLQWLGSRSYSLYLWHWPVFLWIRQSPGDFHEGWPLTLAKLLASCLAAEISWRCLEREPAWRRAPAGLVGMALASAGTATCLMLALPILRPAPEPVPEALSSMLAPVAAPAVQMAASLPARDMGRRGRGSAGANVTVIGDSVMLGARDYLEYALTGILVEARVGRQFSDARQVIRELRASRQLRDVVVLHLGTNGYITESHLAGALADLADRPRVLLVDVRVPRRWNQPNNEMIERLAQSQPNVTLVKWSSLSEQRDDYFVKDGVHLTGLGITALVRAIAQAAELKPPDVAGWPGAGAWRPGDPPPRETPKAVTEAPTAYAGEPEADRSGQAQHD